MYYEISGNIVAVTEAAVLIEIDGLDFWIPKSQIEDGMEIHPGSTQKDFYIAEWLLIEKGIV